MGRNTNVWSKIKSLILVSCGGFGSFTAISIYRENEEFYKGILMPLLHKLDPETSHNLALKICRYDIIPKSKFQDPPSLSTKIFGMHLDNPLGVAAGLDKQGEAVESLHKIGFGFVEVGSVTPEPQKGQNKPRLFRLLSNKALINRMGFNSDGHARVHERLEKLRAMKNSSQFHIGVNLGKNKDSPDAVADYSKGIQVFSDVADYLVVNVSSPNTAGLRDLQQKDQLRNLLSALAKVRRKMPADQQKPLLLKLSPDISVLQRKEIAAVILDPACDPTSNLRLCLQCAVDGIVISNTTTARQDDLDSILSQESGGLSGKPLFQPSTELIADMYRLTEGKLPIIGVGGITSGLDAYHKILAGASVVQLYTAFTYQGPPLITRLKQELDEQLRIDGYTSISEAVGKFSAQEKMATIFTSSS